MRESCASLCCAHPITRRDNLMIRRTALALGILALAASTAQAQTAWPSKPIRLLVPFAAGGTTDLIARVIAEPWGANWANPWWWKTAAVAAAALVPPKPRAPPDGYNLGMATVSTTATNPAINPKIPYNVATDFTHHQHCGHAQCDCGLPQAALSGLQGHAGCREARARQVLVRLARQWQHHPPDDGDVQAGHADLHGARALPWLRPPH